MKEKQGTGNREQGTEKREQGTGNRKQVTDRRYTPVQKNMKMALAIIINSRKGEEYILKGLAKSVWDLYEKYEVEGMYSSFDNFYRVAWALNANIDTINFDDPRADETIEQYIQKRIALDLMGANSLYASAKAAFELFKRLHVPFGYRNFTSLYNTLKASIRQK